MNKIAEPTGMGLRRPLLDTFKPLVCLLLVAFVAAAVPARADDPDDQYLKIFNVIEKADALNSSGKSTEALAKYHTAQTALEKFQKAQPGWNPQMVAFRLEYVGQKIAELAPAAPKAGNEETNAPAPQDQSDATAGAPPEVKLLEPGSEPRKVLRLHPKPGDKQSLALTIQMAMEMKMGEIQNPMKIPPITMTMVTTVKDVSPEGDITYDLVMEDAKIEDQADGTPGLGAAMKTALGGVKGLTGTGVLSSRGVNKGTEIKLPEGAEPQLRQAMDQARNSFNNLSAQLPEEAVGPGARWEVKQAPKTQGMTIHQTATYQIVSIETERVTTSTTLTQSASNQKIENPAMQGIKVDLTKLAGSGKGNITFDLAQLMPSAGSLDMHTEMSMAMNMGNQKQTMNMKMDVNVKLQTK